MDKETVLKEDDIYTIKYKSSFDLTEMIHWKGIKYNDVLYSPVFGNVTLDRIGNTEPAISVRDSSGNLHKFDSRGRLNGNGEVMLFPDKTKNWGTVSEKIYHNIPSKGMLLKENFKAIKEICDIIYRLKLAANYIDEKFDLCFERSSGLIRYVYCVEIEDEQIEDKQIKMQPLSFSWENRIVIKAIDKNNYNPKFKTYCRVLSAERELFEFKSVSAASYFLKLYKDDLAILYSGLLNLMSYRFTSIYRIKNGQTLESFISEERPNRNVEKTFEKEMIICVPNETSPRQKDLSEKDLVQNYFSKDLTKMIKWMNIKKGQSLYSSAFGNLELLSIEKEEPRIKTIDSKKRIYNFTSEGKYFDGGEVILFPEKGKNWLPIIKPLKRPTKVEIEKKTDKDLASTCSLLYRLMVSAHYLDDFFEHIFSKISGTSDKLCTFIVRKEESKYVARCEWVKNYVDVMRHDYRISCFYYFTFNSYSALYYFIKLFKSEIELLYSQLFNVKISEWQVRERLCIPSLF